MPTLEELSALTDDQIIEKVALFMGWRWFDIGTGTAVLVPPHRASQFDQHPALYTPLESAEGKRRNHFDGLFLTDEHEFPPPPAYLTNWNHTMEVVEKAKMPQMRNDPGQFDLTWRGDRDEWEAGFYYIVFDKNPQRAICLAALLAVSQSPQ